MDLDIVLQKGIYNINEKDVNNWGTPNEEMERSIRRPNMFKAIHEPHERKVEKD